MKTGIVRRVDDLGRITIPRNVREMVGITDGTPMEISVEGAKICLEKYANGSYAEAVKHIYNNIKEDDFINDDKRQDICAALDNVIDIMEGAK